MDEMRGLRDDEVERFLSSPLVATLATYRRNATVLLSPVWQEWATEPFHVLLSRDDIKANHVRDNPRVGIVVYEHAPPYRGVEASGMGTLVDGIYGDVLARMAPRYLPDGLPTQLASDGVVLKLVPERLRSWTFEGWFSDHSGQTQ